jgi:hypothetical protein
MDETTLRVLWVPYHSAMLGSMGTDRFMYFFEKIS